MNAFTPLILRHLPAALLALGLQSGCNDGFASVGNREPAGRAAASNQAPVDEDGRPADNRSLRTPLLQ